MFPFDEEDDEIEIEQEEEKIPTDYEIDFTSMKLTGRIITGLDAIIQWVKIVLATDRYSFPQYSWDHGCELSSLIGQSSDQAWIESEAKRMIEDAIMVNDSILGIENVKCSITDEVLTVSFHIDTIYGGGEILV